MNRLLFFIFIIAVLIFSGITAPETVEAMPFFARQISKNCTFCHSAFPKLNETGRIFLSNGYRFAENAEDGWKEVKDSITLPLSAEIEIEGKYNMDKTSGARATSSDMVVEEVELSMAGAMGKAGKISALAMVAVEQVDPSGGGATTYETSIPSVFVQVNDLIGLVGEGRLNVKAGQWEIALPFLSSWQGVVKNRYLAEKTLNIFTPSQRAIELNGSVVAPEKSTLPTHRYSIGLAREDVRSDAKLQGYYATYTATLMEKYNLGVIYRYDKEMSTGPDIINRKYGIAGEAEVGPAIITLGYFNATPDGGNYTTNYLSEALLMPTPTLVFGARYDIVKEKGKTAANAATLMARYNILSNVFTQLEFRNLKDNDHITSSNEDEDRIRLLLVALF